MTSIRNHIREVHHFAAFAVVFVLLVFSAGTGGAQESTKREPLVIITSTGEHKFEVEIAASRTEQARGLMFRRSLASEHGMLFVYPKTQYVSMWMRNTYISLDMIFIRADGRVHRIERATQPLSDRIIESGERIKAVLELVAGAAGKIKLKTGDQVRHSRFNNPPG